MADYVSNPDKVTYFAMTDIRAQRKAFGIKQKDRDRHMYVIGKTGMGKSTLLENLAIQDIQNGEGICFIDPHGSTAEKLLDFVPQNRIKDVMYFAPFDVGHPIAFNVMEDVGYDKRHLVASGLMSAFHRIWGPETWSARMEYILQNTLLALLETPDTTLMDVNRMLADDKFRKKVVANITDPIVRRYWEIEFAQYTDRYKQEAVPAIQNKIGQFVSNPLTRNIVAQPKSSFDMRTMMDEKKIVIVNLSKGRIGELNADLLGSLLVVKIYLAAMSRAELRKKDIEKLPPFFLYVDEFQSVVNESFANILSEARKYKLCMTIAHQYVEQMPEEVAAAVFGNVGTTITFRIGPNDAETLEKIFDPTFTAQDLVGLGFAQIYLTLMIDGVGSRPFSATTLGPIMEPDISYHDEIIAASRATYGKPRKEIEEMVANRERGLSSEFKGTAAASGDSRAGSLGSRSGGGGGVVRGGGDRGRDNSRSDSRDSRDSGTISRQPSRSDDPTRERSDVPRPEHRERRDESRVENRDIKREPKTDSSLGGFGSITAQRDVPVPQIRATGPVGPIVKEEMPLARKVQQDTKVESREPRQDRTAQVRPALHDEEPPEKTRDLLKEALEKFAAKEREREARNATSTPKQPGVSSSPIRHVAKHEPKQVEKIVTAESVQMNGHVKVEASKPEQNSVQKKAIPPPHGTPRPPQSSFVPLPNNTTKTSPQKTAEEIELEALRALLQDDE